uniref:Uncharacterized protein n=1 Tax=Brassica oleracea TaxID=3712 RepID=A0A3P6DV97_BRAOL|nr:unnamed protein product [Brassica oleracea]
MLEVVPRGSRRKQSFETTMQETITGFRDFQRQNLQQLLPGAFDQDDYDEWKKAEALFLDLQVTKHTKFYWKYLNTLQELKFWRKYFIDIASSTDEDKLKLLEAMTGVSRNNEDIPKQLGLGLSPGSSSSVGNNSGGQSSPGLWGHGFQQWGILPNAQHWGTPPNAQQWGTPPNPQQWGVQPGFQQWGTPPNAQKWGTPPTDTKDGSAVNYRQWGTPPTAPQWGTPPNAQQWGTPPNAQQWNTPSNAQQWGTPPNANQWRTPPNAQQWVYKTAVKPYRTIQSGCPAPLNPLLPFGAYI